ncbi:MAG TPA: sugar phosphate isomerase/epimerase family protein [Abditibacteriaceae bacterium]|jgi:sugar phosphate isomerase/epimerase
MKLGISSYAYGWAVGAGRASDASINALGWGNQAAPQLALNEIGLLHRAQQFGLNLVQFGDHMPLHEFDDARLQQLKQHAARHDIELEIGARGLTFDHVVTYARLARELNAPLLRFVIDAPNYHPAPDEVPNILRSALPHLEGTTLGIENHDRFPARVLRDMIEAVGSEGVGVCLDTANSLGAGEGIGEVAEVLAPYTVNLHIKDFTIERLPYLMGFTVSGRPAGGGMLNVPELLQQLQAHGRCRSVILETWVPPQASLAETVKKEAEWVDASVQYLKGFSWSS